MKTAVKRKPGEYLKLAMIHYGIMALYHLVRLSYRVMYGFRLLGAEHIPDDGPAIIVPSDSQGLGAVLAQGLANIGLLEPFFSRENVVAFMHEQLAASVFSRLPMRMRTYGLRPLGSSTLALSLIDGYRQLQRGGIAIIAPEGDSCWDGKTVAVRDGCAWLGLRSAAPLIPLIPTAGCYDIWPFWQNKPNLSGQMKLIVGEPFAVTTQPLNMITEDDLAAAKAHIQQQIDQLRFGAGGIGAWQGVPTLQGQAVSPDIPVRLRKPAPGFQPKPTAIARMGMAILLFQCPICGTDRSIVHHRHLLRPERVHCEACGATWRVARRPGKDYRLTLVQGPDEIIGLDMALSQWYAQAKGHFALCRLEHADGLLLSAGEQPFLMAPTVKLTSHEPISLPTTSGQIEAPASRSEGHLALPKNAVLGEGRLIMTDRRLVWRGSGRDIVFFWQAVRAVHVIFRNVIAINYGAALYTLNLGDESALRWVAHADAILNGQERTVPRKVPVSPY